MNTSYVRTSVHTSSITKRVCCDFFKPRPFVFRSALGDGTGSDRAREYAGCDGDIFAVLFVALRGG